MMDEKKKKRKKKCPIRNFFFYIHVYALILLQEFTLKSIFIELDENYLLLVEQKN